MEDLLYTATQKMMVEFVKKQDEFIIHEIYKHIEENTEYHTFKVSEHELKEVLRLGMIEYQKLYK